MNVFSKVILLLLLIIASVSFSTTVAQSKKVRKSEARAEEQKEKQKKAYLLSQGKDKKRRFHMQTPETKKRMKETKRDARKLNDQNHQPFLKKIFHRKKKK